MNFLFIVFCFIISILSLYSNAPKSDTLELKFICKVELPDELNINIASSAKDKNNQIYILPFVNFASQFIYVFQIKFCKHENTIAYPDNAKYCFISSADTNSWKILINSPLFCYSCTFSFRAIVKDLSNDNIFVSAYTLKKLDDTSFLPVPILMRIDTSSFDILEIVSDTLWLLPLLEFGKKGDLLFCFGKKFLTDTLEQEYFITLFDLFQRKHVYKVSQSEIEGKLGKRLGKVNPITYLLNDSLGICYWYPLSPPIIFNFNQKNYYFFEYKGFFEELKNTNFKVQELDGKTLRKFLYHFYYLNEQIIVLGGENFGEKIQDFELTKLIIQFYNKENFSLLREHQIKLPSINAQIKFFSAFLDEKTKELFFIFYTKDYNYYIFSLEL